MVLLTRRRKVLSLTRARAGKKRRRGGERKSYGRKLKKKYRYRVSPALNLKMEVRTRKRRG